MIKPQYETYLRRMDGILLDKDTNVMLRDQINNAREILEGVYDSLIDEHVPRQYATLIIAEIQKEAVT